MTVDRRTFLLSLAAAGAALVRPPAWIRQASEREVGEAFVEQLQDPVLFEVGSSGTLVMADAREPRTRGECLDIRPGEVTTRERVEGLMDSDERAWDVVAQAFLDAMEQDDREAWDVEVEELRAWLKADDSHVDAAVRHLEGWLSDTDLGEQDYDRAILHGRTAQGAALAYWRDEAELADDLGVIIVEGDCPGSSYFAAELRMDLQEANALAAARGIPIRFVAEA